MTWPCQSTTALPANGYCRLHGYWSGYHGCQACSTAPHVTLEMRPEYLPFPYLQPLPLLPDPLPIYRLVDADKLKRLEELVDELVALAVEILPAEE